MAQENLQFKLKSRPVELPVIGETFVAESSPAPKFDDLSDGQVVLRTLYLSLDPAMRGWLRDVKSYVPPVQIGEVMRGGTVGVIVHSKYEHLKEGDLVAGFTGWQKYALVDGKSLRKVSGDVPPQTYLSALGMTSLTAYFGLLRIGEPKAGDVVLVSGAAGATGSVVGQIAKYLGCYVIGTAGSQDKCDWLTNELGFDVALNYKDPNFTEKFSESTKKGIDVYFDNVGGTILDLALSKINFQGRVVLCGGISQYNKTETSGPKNYLNLLIRSAKMQGFIIMNYASEFPEGYAFLSKMLKEGKLKTKEHIIQGLENAPQGLLDLFEGKNTGKMMIEVSKL